MMTINHQTRVKGIFPKANLLQVFFLLFCPSHKKFPYLLNIKELGNFSKKASSSYIEFESKYNDFNLKTFMYFINQEIQFQ